MELKERIQTWISSHHNDYVNFLQSLIQQPSTNGNEYEAQKLLTERLIRQGLEVDMWEPDYDQLSYHPHFNSTRTSFQGSPNVVTTLKGVGGGRSLILNGHMDVVPEGDQDSWTENPFSGTVKDGKIYGRGSTDMKGGNIAALIALETILGLGITLKGDLIYQSVVEEESGGTGTLSAIERGYSADAALIPEPSQMRIFPKQQGSMWFRVTIFGRSAHGGTRYEGVSAIEKAWLVFQTIMELERTRNVRIEDPLYTKNPIPVPINIGKFSAGYFPSAVADRAVIEGRMGIIPGETIEEAKAEFQQAIDKLGERDEWFQFHPAEVEWFGLRLPPGEMPLDHPFMDVLIRQYKTVQAKEPVIEGSTWGTDGGLLTTVAGIPTVIFGPGTTRMAHFSDEYVEINNIFRTAEIITLAAIQWCGIEHIPHAADRKA